jgi:uncharacterized protein (TIGR02001 family)
MRSIGCLLVCGVVSASGWGTPNAQAQTRVAGSIGATSDFVFRGLSYSRGDAAVQASIELELPSAFAFGAFASSVNPNPGLSPSAELDLWAAYSHSWSDWLATDLRYTHYMYPDDPRVADYDRDELTATLAVRGLAFVSATFSPNTEAIAARPGFSTGDTWTLELSARHALSERWAISAGVGRYFLDEIYGIDYDYWGATLSADFAPIEVHFAVLGSDNAAEGIFTSRTAGERVALTTLYRFGSR